MSKTTSLSPKTLILEKKRNIPSDDLGDYTLLFAGEKKTGKTSIATQFPDHFVLEFEPGNCDHIADCYFRDIHDWNEAKGALKFLQENPDFCQTLVIDDIPSVYDFCMRAVRKFLKKGEDEKPGYDGYDVCSRWFTEWIRDIQKLPIGKIYTAHVDIKESETRTGRTVSQLEPTWTKQCKKIMDTYVTLTGIILMDDDANRQMQIVGDSFVKANNGFQNHFLKVDRQTGKGKQVTKIELGNSPQEGYQNILRAWNNSFNVKSTKVTKSTSTNNGGMKQVNVNDL